MFGSLGIPELIFILALALLVFGPRKLPEIGRTIGRGLSEFRKASTDLKRSINAEMIEEEMREIHPRKLLRDDGAGASAGRAGEATGAKDAGDGEPAVAGGVEGPAKPAAPAGSIPRSADSEAS